MRLNNSIKQAFVRSVLDDTKLVDYTTQIHDRIKKFFYDIAPDAVKKLYDDPKTQGYFQTTSINLTYGNDYLGWYHVPLVPSPDYKVIDMDFLAEVNYLKNLENEQQKKRWDLETKLRGVIDSFTTVKLAREALPEFAKYLPEIDGNRCKTLPAIAGLVADLQNIGWKTPKTA
jgi:Nucleotide modification associated domain 5